MGDRQICQFLNVSSASDIRTHVCVRIDSTADDNGVEGRPRLDHALTAACLVAGAMEGPTVKGRFPHLDARSAMKPSSVREYIKRVAKIMEIVCKHPIFTMDIIGPQTKVRELNG